MLQSTPILRSTVESPTWQSLFRAREYHGLFRLTFKWSLSLYTFISIRTIVFSNQSHAKILMTVNERHDTGKGRNARLSKS